MQQQELGLPVPQAGEPVALQQREPDVLSLPMPLLQMQVRRQAGESVALQQQELSLPVPQAGELVALQQQEPDVLGLQMPRLQMQARRPP